MIDKKIIFMGTPDIAAHHLNILIENKLMLDKYLEAKTSKQASELNQKYIQDISENAK